MKLFEVDDGEKHWIVGETAEEALWFATERYQMGMEADDELTVKEVDDDAILVIGIETADSDSLKMPEGGTFVVKEKYFVKVRATARGWVGVSKRGDLIASTIW